jgi:hypothetical protein
MEAQSVSEEIAIEMFEDGFVTQDQLDRFVEYARTKTTDRLVVFGDDIRDKMRAAYVEAAKRVEL